MLLADDRFSSGALLRKTLVQPGQRGRDSRVLIAQALKQPNDERRRQARRVEASKRRFRLLGWKSPDAEQAIGQGVCLVASNPIAGDLLGRPSQVFDQDDAERDRDRPQLADGQRLNALICADKSE